MPIRLSKKQMVGWIAFSRKSLKEKGSGAPEVA
jgi:hypothetical protein